ncbi:M20 metallopeptidase family protein [Promicromonospora panici]|uniref:M20 metallopeptidase family protein n=1 Tax=Promicromonospora panici TaxID=2219658 RepID=UPI00101D6D37|nr:M20 family metallopeptidase [Promicromonospora panici]
MGLVDDAALILDDLVALRRRLHQHPELGLHLPKTQAAVLEALGGLPLEIMTGAGLSSVVAVLRGDLRGAAGQTPTVLLRGDMDGLPIVEDSGEPFASTTGTMHACGHDLHVAGLVGAARLLSARKHELAGNVVFMFQPGEEGPGGALPMIEEGVLDAAGTPVDAAFGIHVTGLYNRGLFVSKAGPAWAGNGILSVTVRGKGGHGSSPWMAVDPVTVAAEVVMALQSYVTRRINVFDPVVITVGQFHAGTASNVIPSTAQLQASVRTLSNASLEQLAAELPRLVQGVAGAHGCTADVDFQQEYPVTVNDVDMWEHAKTVLTGLYGAERVFERPDPIMGAEDFSFVLERVPGCFIQLGARPDDVSAEGAPSNHSATVRFDDSLLGEQAAALAELAVTTLAKLVELRPDAAAGVAH